MWGVLRSTASQRKGVPRGLYCCQPEICTSGAEGGDNTTKGGLAASGVWLAARGRGVVKKIIIERSCELRAAIIQKTYYVVFIISLD